MRLPWRSWVRRLEGDVDIRDGRAWRIWSYIPNQVLDYIQLFLMACRSVGMSLSSVRPVIVLREA